MRRGQGGERTRARKTGPRAPVSTRRPVARSKGSTGAWGPAFRLGIPGRGEGSLGSAPREWPRGNPFLSRSPGTGFCLQLLASSFLSGAHTCPSALAWPLGGPASKIEASRQQKTPCPGSDRAWALARTASSAGVQFIHRVSGSAPPPALSSDGCLPCARSQMPPGPCADHDPGVQVDGTGGCFSAQSGGRCGLERARPPPPRPFLPFPKVSRLFGSSRSHCHPLNCCLCCALAPQRLTAEACI